MAFAIADSLLLAAADCEAFSEPVYTYPTPPGTPGQDRARGVTRCRENRVSDIGSPPEPCGTAWQATCRRPTRSLPEKRGKLLLAVLDVVLESASESTTFSRYRLGVPVVGFSPSLPRARQDHRDGLREAVMTARNEIASDAAGHGVEQDGTMMRALSNEMVGLHKAHRGAVRRTSTNWAGADAVLVTLEDSLLPAEDLFRAGATAE